MGEKTFIDNQGYRRFNDSKDLVHRWVAYNQVYKKNKDKYKRPFSDYQIHHKDHDKLNNNPENLELITKFDHTITHERFDSKEWIIIKSLGVIIGFLLIMFFYLLVLLLNKVSINWKTILPIFILMIIMYFIVKYMNKEKVNEK